MTARRLAVAHFVLAALLFAACVTTSQRLIAHYTPTLVDAGLEWGTPRLRGLEIRVHPQSDGGAFPTPPHVTGKKWLVDDASFACYSYPSERTLWVADIKSQWVCHGLAHVARSDLYIPDAGICISDLPRLGTDDHAYNATVNLDAKCKEVTPCSDCF